MESQYAQGTLIWIKHEEEVWVQAEIVATNDKEIIVKTDEDVNGRIILGPNEPIFLRSSDVFTSEGLSVLDDLTQLTHLHEPAVLSSLQNRFDVDKIYTFTGPVLIALNPFKRIPGLYDDDLLVSYINAQPAKPGAPNVRPHVYSTANAAYRGICDREKCQTVLISGESGAGKTESTKHVMKFLAMAGAADGEVTNVEKQVLESNPLLEAFGNARTLRNDNSSRFGKFIILQFAEIGGAAGADATLKSSRLFGAKIQTYLLERNRVIDQQEGERNYHFFYEACAAAASLPEGTTTYNFPQVLDEDQAVARQAINLEGFKEISSYFYLTRSSCNALDGVNDVEMFERRIHAMQTIGIPHVDVDNILKCIAAVLALGNTKFDAPPNNSEGSMVMQECSAAVECAASLTGVSRQDLEKALCTVTRATRTEKIRSAVNVRQAADNRDALARALYGIAFNFIVQSTNRSIGYVEEEQLFVGVLDIFGFECFKMNSFEQLCINFTNERLQQFFNSFVFKLEEELYEREGIPWDPLDFPDNQDAVELLQMKTTGIFAILDEECVVPQGSDQGFCNKLQKVHKGHRRLDEIKTKPSWFVVRHFAGPVQYCSDSFLEKNKDQLSNDIIMCMGNSTNEFIKGLFMQDPKFSAVLAKDEESQKVKKRYTVSSEFKGQLSSLMDIVDMTEPHFIRCIKPNPQNKPDIYARKEVTEQLRYGGVLQVVQVSRAGYPVRINHQECWDDYKIIGTPKHVQALALVDDSKIRAQELLDHLTTKLSISRPAHGCSWAVGQTLVFFKLPCFERLKFARLDLLVRSTTLIQSHWRRRVNRQRYKAMLLCARHVEALLRTKQARQELDRRMQERACTRIQAFARGATRRRWFAKVLRGILRIQSRRRAIVAGSVAKDRRLYVNARKLQRAFRRWREQKVYRALRQATSVFQERWRIHAAKQQMRKLKQEASEVGALMAKQQKAQEQSNEFRKRYEELAAQHLQLQSFNKSLASQIKENEDRAEKLSEQLLGIRKAAEDAANLVKDKVAVNSEEMESRKRHAQEKEAERNTLKEQMSELMKASSQQEQSLKEAEQRYQQLLKSTAMQSMVVTPRAGASYTAGNRMLSKRNMLIQLVGDKEVGKTQLLESLFRKLSPEQLNKFGEQSTNLLSHHKMKIGETQLKFLDCTFNARSNHLVKEWFARSHWVLVVYDCAKPKTLDTAMELIKDVYAAGTKVLLFGNRWNVDHGSPMQADVVLAKDAANRLEGHAMESSELCDAVKFLISAEDEAPRGEGQIGNGGVTGDDSNRYSSISAAIGSVRSWLGGAADRQGLANAGVLRPSLKGSRSMKQKPDAGCELLPVQELQDSESAICCLCFGQEKLHKAYILLAVASKEGKAVIYRCYRTEMEMNQLSHEGFSSDDGALSTPPADKSGIAVHTRLLGHSRPITSIFFNLLEDQVLTTSMDFSIRLWATDTGEMLTVFTDSWPIRAAAFMPFNPQVFVSANSNSVLRVVRKSNGSVEQKFKLESEGYNLKFDDTGIYLMVGTKGGSIHVLEANDMKLTFKFKVQLARGYITCMTFVSASHGVPPCLLVNAADSTVAIIDCTYTPAGALTNLTVRHRARIAHSLLPLKNTYSPSGSGYLISGSEDKDIHIISLNKRCNYQVEHLKHHQVPVVAVAVSLQDTLLVSGDSLGRITLWRRLDFSHLQD